MEDFLDASAWGGVVLEAVCYEFKSIVRSMLCYEFLHGNRFVDGRECSLEGLLGSAYKDLFHPGCLKDAPLGMVSDDRRQFVKSHLACLLCKPLVAVVVLGRADGQVQPVWVRTPSFLTAQDHGLDPLVTV